MVKSVKLADIAAEFNVSIVTVSKALSGQKGVSEELRQKIKKAAEEMGYTPVHSTQKSRSKSYKGKAAELPKERQVVGMSEFFSCRFRICCL